MDAAIRHVFELRKEGVRLSDLALKSSELNHAEDLWKRKNCEWSSGQDMKVS